MNPSPVIEPALKENIKPDRASQPFTMVIFGAHGDLTKRKLIPSLFALYTDDFLPEEFCVVGMSRTKMSDEQFRQSMQESLKQFAPHIPFDKQKWDDFAKRLYYLPAHFDKAGGLHELSDLLTTLSKRHGTSENHLFYLSTPPSLYEPILERLGESDLSKKQEGTPHGPWPRIIVEKPFGRDLLSARELDKHLHAQFDEEQIFRIDHYLGKETVQNIMVLRFANGIFEPLWNREHIAQVQITNAETLGVEGRGSYYEEAGNMRDMIQNHMLQLVALVAMEPPISLEAEATRDERTKVLRCLRPFNIAQLDKYAVRGQYGPGYIAGHPVSGYRQEPDVANDSQTETFTALKLYIDNWRWADVPFYVRSGKRLKKHITEIAVYFKKAPHRLFNLSLHNTAGIIGPNALVIKIQPDEGISLKFLTKEPGTETKLRWLSMDFNYGSAFGTRAPQAYERLIHDCIIGDASLFARSDAVQASWELITPVLEAWAKTPAKHFPNYDSGSWGPPESKELLAINGDVWRSQE